MIHAESQIARWYQRPDGVLLLAFFMGSHVRAGDPPVAGYFVDRRHVYKPGDVDGLDRIAGRRTTYEQALEIWGTFAGRPTVWEKLMYEKPIRTTLVAAVNPQGVIGLQGAIPWRRKADMRRFKKRTMGGVLIMGRKTYESLPNKNLKGREIIVISHNPKILQDQGVRAVSNVDLALQLAEMYFPGRMRWIAGGSQIYEAALPYVEALDLTEVPDVVDLSLDPTFMPGLPLDEFRLVAETANPDDPELKHFYYERK